VQQRSNARRQRSEKQEGSEADQELGMGSLRNGIGGQAGRQDGLYLSDDLGGAVELGARLFFDALHHRVRSAES
jgi:hypothetical protein